MRGNLARGHDRHVRAGSIPARAGEPVIGFLEEGGKIWQVAVKISGDATETYLTTLHRAQHRDIVAARRRYKRIQGR